MSIIDAIEQSVFDTLEMATGRRVALGADRLIPKRHVDRLLAIARASERYAVAMASESKAGTWKGPADRLVAIHDALAKGDLVALDHALEAP